MSVLGKRQRDDNHNNIEENSTDKQLTSPPPKKPKLDECDDDEEDNDINGLDIEFCNTKSNKLIKLNVGGIKYETTIQTLIGYNSMLKARFSGKYATKPCQDGSYFIDRNGELFKYILEYLRNGQLLLPTVWDKNDIYKFYIEVKYYQIESLFKPVLLKLFDSKILTNNILKMKIIDKISSHALQCNVNQTIQYLNEWKLLYKYDESNFTRNDIAKEEFTRNKIRFETVRTTKKSLLLIEAGGQIYGLFLSMYPNNNAWHYQFATSFAFRCGWNSQHLPSYVTDKDINVIFDNVRNATQDEVEQNQNENTCIIYELYPVLIYAYTVEQYHAIGDFVLKYMVEGTEDDLDEVIEANSISKIEFWSIPSR